MCLQARWMWYKRWAPQPKNWHRKELIDLRALNECRWIYKQLTFIHFVKHLILVFTHRLNNLLSSSSGCFIIPFILCAHHTIQMALSSTDVYSERERKRLELGAESSSHCSSFYGNNNRVVKSMILWIHYIFRFMQIDHKFIHQMLWNRERTAQLYVHTHTNTYNQNQWNMLWLLILPEELET